MKLQNAKEDVWLQVFNRKWKLETGHVQTKYQCMQAKFVLYIKKLEAIS